MKARTPLLQGILSLLSRTQNSEGRLPRRKFLKAGAAGVLVFGINKDTKAQEPALPKEDTTAPAKPKVAILGGGLAGLTTAYRLVQKEVPCVLIEAQDRLGGRVRTQSEFGLGASFVELGAEWIRSNESPILKLCDELQVPTQSIPSEESGIEKEMFWAGGKLRGSNEVSNALKSLAGAIKGDQRKIGDKPSEHPDFQAFDKMNLQDYLKSKKSQAEGWLLDLLDVALTCEFGADTRQQSAMNFLLLTKPSGSMDNFIHGGAFDLIRIKGGSSRLVDAFSAFLQKDLEIQQSTRLVKLSKTPAGRIEITTQTGETTKAQIFDRVVCTIPFSVLRNILGVETIGFTSSKLKAIKELGYATNRKFIFETRGRLWREKKVGAKPFSGSATGDFSSQSFYESSRGLGGKFGLLTNFRGGYQGVNFSGIESDKAQVFSDFEKFCPGVKESLTNETASFSWPNFGYSLGSYSCPKPGQHHEILPSISQPELGRRIIFAGEHLSLNFSGSMAGAIETGEAAARDLLSDL